MLALKNASFVGIALVAVLAAPASAEPFDFDAEYISCLDREEYAIGGSMAGDCFIDQAREIEADIETLLHQVSKRFCSAQDRHTLDRAQSLWLEHRELSCTLVEDSPGNTGSHIAAGACWLDTARKHLEMLRIIENNSYAWCHDMQFLPDQSQFGNPTDALDAVGSERVEQNEDDGTPNRMLDIFANLEAVISLDLTHCTYCESGADCGEGLFVFEYLDGDDEASAPAGLPLDKALLHACRKPDGIAFVLVAGLQTEPRIVESQQGWQAFDWLVDDGRIVLTDGADTTIAGAHTFDSR